MIAFFIGICAIGIAALACLLYVAWAGLSLAFDYVGGSLRRARGRDVPQPAELTTAGPAGA